MGADAVTNILPIVFGNGHTTLNIPVLVRSLKVKQRWAGLVLGWETAWEFPVLLALFVHLTYSLGQFTGTLSRSCGN